MTVVACAKFVATKLKHCEVKCCFTAINLKTKRVGATPQKGNIAMIEIGYAHLYQPGFVELVKRLGKVEGMPAKTAYRVGKISQALLKNFTVADTKRLGLIEKHVVKEESGAWKKDDQGELVFDDKEAIRKEVDELLETRFTIEQLPVDIEQLDAAKLTPAELLQIDFMLDVK